MLRVIRWSSPTTLGELSMISRIHESEEFGSVYVGPGASARVVVGMRVQGTE